LLEVYSRGIKRWCKIEQSFLRICIKGARSKAASGENIYLLWPYDKNSKLIPIDDIKAKFPNGWNYLKIIEKKLRNRENGKFDDDKWYRFGRSQNIDICSQPKIIVPAILKTGVAIIDKRGDLSFTASGEGGGGGWAIRPKEGTSITLDSLAEYLQSDAVWQFIKALGFPKSSGWRGVDKSILEIIPVPEL